MARQVIKYTFSEIKEFCGESFPSPMVLNVRLKVKDKYVQFSDIITLECTNPVPSAPTGLSATALALTISLTWDQHPDDDLKNILVYRHTSDDSASASLAYRADPKATYYTDVVPLQGTYYYWLKAVDVYDQTSDFSTGTGAKTTVGISEDELGALQLIVPSDSSGTAASVLAGFWDGDLDTLVASYMFGQWLEYRYPIMRYIHGIRLCTQYDERPVYFAVQGWRAGNWTFYAGNSSDDHTVDGTAGDEILRRYETEEEAALSWVEMVGEAVGSHYEMVYEFGDSTETPGDRKRLPQIVRAVRIYPMISAYLTEFRPATYVAAEDIFAGTFYATRGIVLQDDATGSGWKLDKNGATFLNTSITITDGLLSTHIAAGAITTPKLDADSVTADKIDVSTLSAISANMGTLTAGTINMYTGTWDSNATGFRLNATEIAGQNAGIDQVVISAATGKLTAGAGRITLSQDGILIKTDSAHKQLFRFQDESGSPTYITSVYTDGLSHVIHVPSKSPYAVDTDIGDIILETTDETGDRRYAKWRVAGFEFDDIAFNVGFWWRAPSWGAIEARIYYAYSGNVNTLVLEAPNGIDIQALLRCDSFRIDQTPTAETPAATHTVPVNLNGTAYKLLCLAA